MNTTHEKACEARAIHCLETEPSAGAWFATLAKNISSNYYDESMMNIIFQEHWHGKKLSFGTVWAFGQIHAAMFSGQISVVTVDAAGPPCPDRDTEGNNRLISDLPEPFRAKFFGGLEDQDGYLSWDAPIRTISTVGNDDMTQSSSVVMVEPNSIPLEVGSTKASRTLLHLAQERALARWPYGSDKITVLTVLDKKLWWPAE